jgi:type IV secretory pathway VirB10-like protein
MQPACGREHIQAHPFQDELLEKPLTMHTKSTNTAGAVSSAMVPAAAWRKFSLSLTLGGALLAAATLAHAQYVWIDAQGHKVYSDRSPPASVPVKNIIRAPGRGSEPKGPAAQAAPDAAGPGSKGKPGEPPAKPPGPMTTAEREADFRKRRTEAGEKEKKDAEDAQRQATKAAGCADLRSTQKSLAAGTRMASTDENGKHSFLSDEERQQRAERVAEALNDCD